MQYYKRKILIIYKEDSLKIVWKPLVLAELYDKNFSFAKLHKLAKFHFQYQANLSELIDFYSSWNHLREIEVNFNSFTLL